MELTSENVEKVIRGCMYTEEDLKDLPPDTLPEGCVVVHSVMIHTGFHPDRLEAAKENINSMLEQLPESFFEDMGDFFAHAYLTREGEHWGEHSNIDKLISLGLAIGRAKFQLPREAWSALPGGLPIIFISKE